MSIYTFRGQQVEVEVTAGSAFTCTEPGEPPELVIVSIDGVPIDDNEEVPEAQQEQWGEWYLALCNHVGEQMYIDDQAAADDYAKDLAREAKLITGSDK